MDKEKKHKIQTDSVFGYELLLFKILLGFLQSLFPFCEKHSFNTVPQGITGTYLPSTLHLGITAVRFVIVMKITQDWKMKSD